MDATRNTPWWYQQWEDRCGTVWLVCSLLPAWCSFTTISSVVIWSDMLGGVQSGTHPIPWHWEPWDLRLHYRWKKAKKTITLPPKIVPTFINASILLYIKWAIFVLSYRNAIFSQCWHYTPEDRPTFEEIVSSLQEYWDEQNFWNHFNA